LPYRDVDAVRAGLHGQQRHGHDRLARRGLIPAHVHVQRRVLAAADRPQPIDRAEPAARRLSPGVAIVKLSDAAKTLERVVIVGRQRDAAHIASDAIELENRAAPPLLGRAEADANIEIDRSLLELIQLVDLLAQRQERAVPQPPVRRLLRDFPKRDECFAAEAVITPRSSGVPRCSSLHRRPD
jgi:hypothetical protein